MSGFYCGTHPVPFVYLDGVSVTCCWPVCCREESSLASAAEEEASLVPPSLVADAGDKMSSSFLAQDMGKLALCALLEKPGVLNLFRPRPITGPAEHLATQRYFGGRKEDTFCHDHES